MHVERQSLRTLIVVGDGNPRPALSIFAIALTILSGRANRVIFTRHIQREVQL
jgi:hypothetical protein